MAGFEVSTEAAAGVLAELSYPHDVTSTIVICASFADFLRSLDPAEVWRRGFSGARIELAIRLAVFSHLAGGGHPVSWGNLPAFSLGREFLKSVAACGFDGDLRRIRRLLRACRETILREALAGTHHLRIGSGAAQPQRRRGDDAAWRRDIDYEYHLHYWECTSGPPELACVVAHGDFNIPD
jgi:hypothetical protein